MSKKRAIVFGGSGFLGSHVADILTKNNYQVTIVDKFKSKWINKKQRFIKAELGDLEKYSKYIKFVFNHYLLEHGSDDYTSTKKSSLFLHKKIIKTSKIMEKFFACGDLASKIPKKKKKLSSKS